MVSAFHSFIFFGASLYLLLCNHFLHLFCCSIIESADFSSTQLPLIFDSTELQLRQCVRIPIEDDQIYESQETFLVTLDSSNPDVIVTLGNSTVTILDNDCMPTFKLTYHPL